MKIAKIEPQRNYTRFSSAVLALTLLWTALAYAQEHKSGHWSYNGDEGPSHWGDLNPDFAACKNGHRQSPIDIRNPEKADLTAIQFDYKPSPLHIIDNGHTIMINYESGTYRMYCQARSMNDMKVKCCRRACTWNSVLGTTISFSAGGQKRPKAVGRV